MKYIQFFLSKLLYVLIFGKNMYNGLIFLLFLYPMKYLRSCLPKGSLLDDTILLMSTFFFFVFYINIYKRRTH